MLQAARATLSSAEKIQKGKAAIGKFDGEFSSVACATLAGKVFIHSPHEQQAGARQVAYLNINKQITSIVAGKWRRTPWSQHIRMLAA